jgi:glycosyltransferase involved in cell wall biosynthesis
MKTVCELIDYGGKTGGSFIEALGHLSRAVRESGDRFVVVASAVAGETWSAELEAQGARVLFAHDARDALTKVRELQPQIVHTHFTKYDVAAAGLRGPRVIWHVHSVREDRSPLAELRGRVKYRWIGRNVSDWLCVSEGVRREVLQRGAPPKRVRVVANGINTERFRPPSTQERELSRERFGIRPQDRVVLFFDRTPVKGGAVLRDAFESLRGVRLLVNGGPDDDWNAFARDHDVIRAPRMADPRPLYWAADALALPSLGEGFALVLAEAAACGLPAAASDIPPALEMLGGSPDAFIFPRGDSERLAEAIENALACGAPQAARARIVQSFSLERWTQDLVRIYNS